MTPKHTDIAGKLRQRFFSGLHLGILEPGIRLPSANEIAVEMGVDRRAVLQAYRELEREGIVELRQRSGIFFGARPQGLPGLTPPAAWAVDVVTRAIAMGIPAPRFADWFRGRLSTDGLRALCVECNDDQLGALSAEMRSDYGFETDSANVDELLAERTPGDKLKRAAILVTTHFHAGEVKELAARVGRPWIAVSLRTDIYAEIARLLRSSAVYFVVVDARFEKKLHRIFESVSGAAGFHALVIGRDDVTVIPYDAPVYITRAARARVDDDSLLQRVLPEERVFSQESAREILSLVITSNMAVLPARETAVDGSAA